jgi:hypothetical protein
MIRLESRHGAWAGGVVWGFGADVRTRKAIGGALVTDPVSRAQARTDATGYFLLPVAARKVTVSGDGYQTGSFALREPVTTAGARPSGPGERSLGQSGNLILLVPVEKPAPAPSPNLVTHLTASYCPGLVAESHGNQDGSLTRFGGLLPLGVRLGGMVRLEPFLIEGRLGYGTYPLAFGDTGDVFWRQETQVAVSGLFPQQWGRSVSTAFGPALLVDQIGISRNTLAPGASYVEQGMTRVALGVMGIAAYTLPVPVPVLVDARLAVHPATWVEAARSFSGIGVWTLDASLGARWMLWGQWGVDARYAFLGWQANEYYQSLHGLAVGGVRNF